MASQPSSWTLILVVFRRYVYRQSEDAGSRQKYEARPNWDGPLAQIKGAIGM